MAGAGGARRWARGDLPPQLTSGEPDDLWGSVRAQPATGMIIRLERPQKRRSRRSRIGAFLIVLLVFIAAVAIVVYLYR